MTREKLDKYVVLVEQGLSSLFNFAMVIFLSRVEPSAVSLYGVSYAIFLLVSGFIRNSVFNPILVNGVYGSKAFFFLLKDTVKEMLFITSCIVAVIYMIATDIYSGLLVVLFFLFNEFSRVLAIANRRTIYFLAASSFAYTLILFTSYMLNVELGFATGLIFSVVYLLVSSKYYTSNSDEDVSRTSARSSFVLTASYFTVTNVPLLFLQAIWPIGAAVFIQVRSLFQPLMLLSRVFDLLDKRSAASQKKLDFSSLKKRFMMLLSFSLIASFLMFIISIYFFDYIFGEVGVNHVYVSLAFMFVIVLMFVVKPIETFFFKNAMVSSLSRSRIIGALICFALCMAAFFVPKELVLEYLTVSMLITWASIFFINLVQINDAKRCGGSSD